MVSTVAEIEAVWQLATAAYPNFKAPAATLVLWEQLLADVDGPLLRAAALKCITDGEFFPTVHALRVASATLAAAEHRSGAEAWGDVQMAIALHGVYHPPAVIGGSLDQGNYEWTFKDPKVLALVKSIGWANLCASENGMADRAHFLKAYEQMQTRQDEQLRELPAVAEVRQAVQGRAAEAARLTSGIGKG